MASRTFLIRTPATTIGELDPLTWRNDDYLATAAHIIPIFWPALFDKTNLVTREIRDENGEPFRYPVLLEDAHTAVERAARRARTIFEVLPASYRELYQTFVNYVSRNAPQRLYFEGLERWTTGTPAAYLALLENCLAAFAPEATAGNWAVLLAQADISDLKDIEPFALAGSRWTRAVPWKSTDDER